MTIIYRDLKTEVGNGLTDETEWRSDMYLHDNIESHGVVWHGVYHLVECEHSATVVHAFTTRASFSIYSIKKNEVGSDEWV